MQETLYVFRLRDTGALAVTTNQSGSRLPIDNQLDYKAGDWKFVARIKSAELPNLLTSDREVEPALQSRGYYPFRLREVLEDHPLRKHLP